MHIETIKAAKITFPSTHKSSGKARETKRNEKGNNSKDKLPVPHAGEVSGRKKNSDAVISQIKSIS